jgi:phage terminase small subunit
MRTKRKAAARRKTAKSISSLLHEQAGLIEPHYQFCLLYLSNGYNASGAYKAVYPAAQDNTARTGGYDLLTKPDVKAFLALHLKDRWKRFEMDADEASARVALDARADLRLLLDEHGKVRPPAEWPDEIANSVKSLKTTKDGVEVRLNDSLAARRLILELTGKLKGANDGLRDLAEILAEKFKA